MPPPPTHPPTHHRVIAGRLNEGAPPRSRIPLKVTHAADCAGTAPTLSLQMDTVALAGGSLTVGGFDVAAALTHLTTTG